MAFDELFTLVLLYPLRSSKIIEHSM